MVDNRKVLHMLYLRILQFVDDVTLRTILPSAGLVIQSMYEFIFITILLLVALNRKVNTIN
jgi:hypothetical protein